MRAKPVKCYVGNYDGQRNGMVYATSKREAAQVAGCSVYHFERYWHIHHSLYAVANPKAMSLYTRKNDYYDAWHEGLCPL